MSIEFNENKSSSPKLKMQRSTMAKSPLSHYSTDEYQAVKQIPYQPRVIVKKGSFPLSHLVIKDNSVGS